ncbi:nuclear transport factor 2 family protein [Marivirga sp. S37H4]|uniref:Nuclear transport factor 2 family protein n=1 Tax=Marivirga aurantiaca TaxID=2802615 RepID=A0A935CCP6_9BACT|nr:nuclear transport factor 2 family protein [Marivirga aurantiaca]MBK6266203.1 nuclear transport factor 2 family protein [Marivirga aurantiaca]
MIKNDTYRKIIENYIQAYNRFDIEKMLIDMHDGIVFENISNGEVNLSTAGIVAFKEQAEKAKGIFKERKQKITDFHFYNDQVNVDIDYNGILAVDLINDLKSGDRIELKGQSAFKFKDNKIIEIKDIS